MRAAAAAIFTVILPLVPAGGLACEIGFVSRGSEIVEVAGFADGLGQVDYELIVSRQSGGSRSLSRQSGRSDVTGANRLATVATTAPPGTTLRVELSVSRGGREQKCFADRAF